MRIGIDVDSGERSFEELVRGALKAFTLIPNITIFLIGKSERIRKSFPEIESNTKIFLVDAKEVILMDESPTFALKKKRDATVLIGCRMLASNTIDVFFSPGNTGATVAASVLTLGMIKGVKKPAMAAFFPRKGGGETLILDIGANPECNEESFSYNAILGQAYYSVVFDKPEPTIGLLNMGVEFGKGSTNIKKAFSLLSGIPSFIGNVEGYNVLNGSVDIVLCDGFTGNCILKFAESMRELFASTLLEVFSDNSTIKLNKKNLLTYTFNMLGVYKEKKKMISDRVTPKYFGAVPLLGVNGTVLVGHGMCSEKDLVNAIMLANKLYKDKYLEKIISNLEKIA